MRVSSVLWNFIEALRHNVYKTSLYIHPRTPPLWCFNSFPFSSEHNGWTLRSSCDRRNTSEDLLLYQRAKGFVYPFVVLDISWNYLSLLNLCYIHVSVFMWDRDRSSVFCVSSMLSPNGRKQYSTVPAHVMLIDLENWRVAHLRKQIDAHHLYYRNEGLLHILMLLIRWGGR